MNGITLDKAIRTGDIQLGRGNIISSEDIAKYPGDYPIYSSSAKGSGEFGRYGHYMFDEELITWSVDGGGRFFFRPKHKFSVTNVCGYMYVDGEKWNRQFVYYALDFQHQRITFDYQTKAHPSVIRDLYSLPSALKPEQTKIAEILSAVDQAIKQTGALIAKQQRIRNGLMQDLLTRGIDENGDLRFEDTHEFKDSPIGRIPAEWEVERIEQKLDRIIDYRGRTPTKVEAGVPLLTAKNVRDGYIDEEPREFIAESAFNSWMTRGIPKPGDVLFTTEAPMGNVALVPEYRISLAQRLLTLCPKPDELSQDYLFWLLHWRHSTERLELLTSGSTVVGVKQSVFRKVEFRFPRLEEQRRISVILNSLDSASKNQGSNLTKLRSLKTALMQDLLTGKVSVTPLLAEVEVGA